MRPPFRLGTTSYILPEAILPNVHFLAGKVQDIELVLFEVDEQDNPLPDRAQISELRSLAQVHDLSYTIHLPLALSLGEEGERAEAAMVQSESAIQATSALQPFAYIAHLGPPAVDDLQGWLQRVIADLQRLTSCAGSPDGIAIENAGGVHPQMPDVMAIASAGRCVDVGHLWHAGVDPLPELEHDPSRLRVVHLHGAADRDHRSLACVPQSELARVLRWLVEHDFGGVVTLEVFGLEDFWSSQRAVLTTLEELWAQA